MSPQTPPRALLLLSSPGPVALYESTGGAVTSQFASHNLTLLPPIPPGSVVHDNACGPGTVSRLLSSPLIPGDVKIHATDTDSAMLSALSASNLANVEVSDQAMEHLSFPAATFTHSIANIGIIFSTSAGLDAAREIHRTLQHGGVAVVNCWREITWLAPWMRACTATRPGTPRVPPPQVNWADGTHLQSVMVEAGFKREGMRVETSEAWAKTADVRKWAEEAWTVLGAQMGWGEGDGENWDRAVDVFVEGLMASEGTERVGGEVWMRASQWVVIVTK